MCKKTIYDVLNEMEEGTTIDIYDTTYSSNGVAVFLEKSDEEDEYDVFINNLYNELQICNSDILNSSSIIYSADVDYIEYLTKHLHTIIRFHYEYFDCDNDFKTKMSYDDFNELWIKILENAISGNMSVKFYEKYNSDLINETYKQNCIGEPYYLELRNKIINEVIQLDSEQEENKDEIEVG